MAIKYLDYDGLLYFWQKLKLLFATKDTATQSADGLMSSSDKTKLDGLDQLVESASGESVTTSNCSGLESVVVYGKSVQNGTPTPSNPVPIEVVSGLSMPSNIEWRQGSVSNSTGNEGSDANRIHTAMFEIVPGATYTVGVTNSSYQYSVRLFSGTRWISSNFVYGDSTWKSSDDTYANPNAKYMSIVIRLSSNANLSPSDSENVGAFATTSCIGLAVDGTVTPIDLQGNILASLPDGTRDELTIDSTGAVTLTKRVGKVTVGTPWNGVYSFATVTNGARWYLTPGAMSSAYSQQIPDNSVNGYSTMAKFVKNSSGLSTLGDHMYTYDNRVYYVISGITTSTAAVDWVNSYNATVVYPLKTPQTITLTPITMPDVQSGDTITVVAALTPTIRASWWTSFAQPIANAIKYLSQQT